MPRRRCFDPTHTRRDAKNRCLVCQDARKSAAQKARKAARRAERGEVLLLPTSASYRSAVVAAAWVTRRAKYGASGMSAEGLAAQQATQRRRRRGWCKRGHRLTPDNVLRTSRGRTCRACNIARSRRRHQQQRLSSRPAWVEVRGVRMSVEAHDAACLAEGRALWTRMLNAHPDRGGTQRKFEAARRRWDRWLATETAWYAAAGVPLPDGLRRRSDERQAA